MKVPSARYNSKPDNSRPDDSRKMINTRTPMKYQTGDIFLGNMWNISSVFNQVIDPTSRWSEIGMFEVFENADLGNGPEVLVTVVMMTPNGVNKIPLSTLLRDPLLQAAAHRSFIYTGKAAIIPSIGDVIKSLVGKPKESLAVIAVQTQLNALNNGTLKISRTGITSGELINTILSSFKLTLGTYIPSEFTPISTFQEGGAVDELYGSENPLFPSMSAASIDEEMQSRSTIILDTGDHDSERLLVDYMAQKPPLTLDQHRAESSFPINENRVIVESATKNQVNGNWTNEPNRNQANGSKLNNGRLNGDGHTTHPMQMPSLTKKKKKSNRQAEVNHSDITTKKIIQRNDAKDNYTRPTP